MSISKRAPGRSVRSRFLNSGSVHALAITFPIFTSSASALASRSDLSMLTAGAIASPSDLIVCSLLTCTSISTAGIDENPLPRSTLRLRDMCVNGGIPSQTR